MSRLTWGAAGKRFYEAGVDRGVLFITNGPGVPWSGLISVSEEPVGGDLKSHYIDGFNYMNRIGGEEFTATIEAYTYPDEFAECDGTRSIGNGLFATQQRRKSFGLSYRSKVGNDVDGIDHAYKIHLVYNALVQPASSSHTTIGESIEPDNFSWKVASRPPILEGYRPTAHFVIDSRETPSEVLAQIEDILYGSDTLTSRLPSVGELAYIFTSYHTSIFDAGDVNEPYYNTFDAGTPAEPYTSTIDGGAP